MSPQRRRQRASSFGPAADLYDRIRPTYPAEAVAWAIAPLGQGRWRVADIGAGTGIMTRVLVGLGQNVTAVEPDALMRDRLIVNTPGVEVVLGTAEDLPFADAELDSAVAGQAYHWFEPDEANLELGRVIRTGGTFAAIWNERDESRDWVLAYSRIVEGERGASQTGPAEGGRGPSFGELFTPAKMAVFHHAVPSGPDELVGLLRSRSYYLTATPDRQAELEDEVRELARSHPALAGRAEFLLPYVTRVFRALRR